jgi:hypothetical protein
MTPQISKQCQQAQQKKVHRHIAMPSVPSRLAPCCALCSVKRITEQQILDQLGHRWSTVQAKECQPAQQKKVHRHIAMPSVQSRLVRCCAVCSV